MKVGILHQVWAVSEISDRQCIEDTMADVRLADQLGYDSFWFGEHHFGRDKAYFGRVPIPELLIARLAAETERIHLGTGVKVLPFDSASRFAEAMSLLDLLTNHRAVFGVGMAVRTDPLAQVHDRGPLFRQQLTQLLAYLRGETHDSLPPITPAPECDLTHLIWIAARETESVDYAAQLGLHFVVGQAETGQRQRDHVDRYRAAGGQGEARGVRMVLVAETDSAAYALAERPAYRTFNQMKKGKYYLEAVQRGEFPATDPTEIEDVLRRMEYIVGSPATVADGLRRYVAESGVDRVDLMVHVPGVSLESVRRSMVLFAEEVAPRVGMETASLVTA